MPDGFSLFLFLILLVILDAPAAAQEQISTTDFSFIHGADYVPSYAKTSVQYWSDFRPAVFEKEMSYGQELGFNSVRIWLQYWSYEHDPSGFLNHVDEFLTIASKHGIRPMLVIFDSCFGISPSAESAEQWVASPGPDHMGEDFYPAGDRYVRTLMERFGKDQRVLMWDVMNEPESTWLVGAPGGKKLVYDFVRHYIRYTHSFNPIQPVTMGANDTHNDEVVNDVDVLSLHSYQLTPEQFRKDIEKTRGDAARVHKPFIITECAAPGWGMDYDWTMKVLREEKIGYYVWQLMVGSDQFREVGGLVYPDGRVRDPDSVAVVSGKPAQLFTKKPDDQGIPIEHQPRGHIDWQHLYWLTLQRFKQTPTNSENFSERSTYFQSFVFMKQFAVPIWLAQYQPQIDQSMQQVHLEMTSGKEPQAFAELDRLIASVSRPH